MKKGFLQKILIGSTDSAGSAQHKINPKLGLRDVKGAALISRQKENGDTPAKVYFQDWNSKDLPKRSNIICTNKLRIGTWNIWFGNERQQERMNELMSIIDKEEIDIFCFQEVTQSLLECIYTYLASNDKFDYYYVSGVSKKDTKAYGNVIFSKYPIEKVYFLDFTEHGISHMSRQLVCCDFLLTRDNSDTNEKNEKNNNNNNNNDGKNEEKQKDDSNKNTNDDKNKEIELLRMGNVHLESLDPNQAKRQYQIEMAYDFMCNNNQQWGKNIANKCDHIMIMGDFNQCGTIATKNGLKIPNELNDAWIVANTWNKNDKNVKNNQNDNNENKNEKESENDNVNKGLDDSISNDEPMYTNNFGKFVKRLDSDPILNDAGWTMPATEYFEAWRPDRLIYSLNRNKREKCQWKLDSIKRIGMEPFPDKDTAKQYQIQTPSDHYGLVIQFTRE